jgi:hypothetical protein
MLYLPAYIIVYVLLRADELIFDAVEQCSRAWQ